jgi:hypothetical protein
MPQGGNHAFATLQSCLIPLGIGWGCPLVFHGTTQRSIRNARYLCQNIWDQRGIPRVLVIYLCSVCSVERKIYSCSVWTKFGQRGIFRNHTNGSSIYYLWGCKNSKMFVWCLSQGQRTTRETQYIHA